MGVTDQFLDEVTMDDLIDEQREIAEITGIEAYRNLVRHFSGEQIRIWSISKLIKKIRDNQICHEYDGHNVKQLSRKYGLSDQTIEKLIKEANSLVRVAAYKKSSQTPDENINQHLQALFAAMDEKSPELYRKVSNFIKEETDSVKSKLDILPK